LCFARIALPLRGDRAADHPVRIELQQPRRGQVLTRLHIVDTPDHEIARAAVDVEQVVARYDFAQRADPGAVDLRDCGLG
jgi:hypothetical protein